jgi:hypothetical protein
VKAEEQQPSGYESKAQTSNRVAEVDPGQKLVHNNRSMLTDRAA